MFCVLVVVQTGQRGKSLVSFFLAVITDQGDRLEKLDRNAGTWVPAQPHVQAPHR